MDEIREIVRPGSHTREDRDVAYSVMLQRAEQSLRKATGVILDATFTRRSQRRALCEALKDFPTSIYLLQCRVEPDDAVSRFRNRPASHPAVDLDECRVRKLAEEYPYDETGLQLFTSGLSVRDLTAVAVSHLSRGSPVEGLDEWCTIGT